MQILDYLLIALIAVLAILAIRSARRSPCCKDCARCNLRDTGNRKEARPPAKED